MKTNSKAKRILAYGDSITWERVPNLFIRYDEDTRWTAVLQQQLGDDYDVIEEGLRGRFLAGENPYIPNRDGLRQFGPILASQFPIDLIIIFLGTNDTNSKAMKSAEDIANGLEEYSREINDWCEEFKMPTPKILIIAPPHIDESVLKVDSMFEGASVKSKQFSLEYQSIANKLGATFFDSSKHVVPGSEDGVHIDGDNHKKLGLALSPVIKSLLS